MCGIAGFYDPQTGTADAPPLLEKMLESIAHRGPDARGRHFQGPLALGHNRLSIIDLSDAGNQPMEYFDARIVYNGEIYNYPEIRKDLEQKGYRFTTKSDTEVILACYREYGEKCTDYFMGMWAFALWDIKEEILFCSRDRFGIKPFYYIHSGNRFYFGSEYKALKQSPVFSPSLNWSQVNRGLQLGWNCYRDETYFECIRALPAACNLLFRNGKPVVYHYWKPGEQKVSIPGTFHERCNDFRKLFMRSVEQHMRSDVEIGGCLSGGLDSSAIAGGVGTLFPDSAFKTFTVYYDGEGEVDERPWVSEVLKKFSCLKPFYLKPSPEDIAAAFDRALYHADVPIAGSSPVSQYFVMQLAAEQKIKVLLDGQGSDEYLGGYMHSFYRLIGGHLRNFRFGSARRELQSHVRRQHHTFSEGMNIFMKSVLAAFMEEQALYRLEYKKYFPFTGPDTGNAVDLPEGIGSRLKRFFSQLLEVSSLPTLLQFEDRNSMAFSIESRVPFLDHRLVDYAFSLEDDDIMKDGETKRILRHSLNGILPDAIANRSDKKGFVTPGEVKWLRNSLSFLLDQDFSSLEFMDQNKIRLLIREFKNGDNSNAVLVWRIAVFRYWWEKNC